jgi:hypothetical protein
VKTDGGAGVWNFSASRGEEALAARVPDASRKQSPALPSADTLVIISRIIVSITTSSS